MHQHLQAATAGHGWWPVGLADALQGLTHLSLSRNAVKALPSELSRLTALRELNLRDNMLGEPKPLVFGRHYGLTRRAAMCTCSGRNAVASHACCFNSARLPAGERACPIPILPKLQRLNASFNRCVSCSAR